MIEACWGPWGTAVNVGELNRGQRETQAAVGGQGGGMGRGAGIPELTLTSTLLPDSSSSAWSAVTQAARTGAQAEGRSSLTVGSTYRGELSTREPAPEVSRWCEQGLRPGPSSGSAWGSSSAGTACAASGLPQVWPWARGRPPHRDSCARSFQALPPGLLMGPPV